MRRAGVVLLVVTFLFLLFATGGSSAPFRAAEPRGPYVSDEVLVAFRGNVNRDAVARTVGGRVKSVLPRLGVYVLKVPPHTVGSAVAALRRNPQVRFAEPNAYLHIFLDPNDPYDNTSCHPTSEGPCIMQWGWAKVSAYAAWDVTTGSAAVRVAVVDTGIDVGDTAYPFPDYTGNVDIVSCQSPITVDFSNSGTSNDDNGHGTHVAGTIGACTNNGTGVAGANWAVQLMGVKVLDFLGSGTLEAVAAGITWAADNGAKVINLSLGIDTPLATLEQAVNYAWNTGAVLACAAGNDGTTTKNYPAAYPNCIAVAATNAADQKAWFSNHGADWVDVAAPGEQILSTVQDQWDWSALCWGFGYCEAPYEGLSGTSMAAPHVAGLAALVWAKGDCATNACVRSKIESTADAIGGTGTYWQYGRVNYAAALGSSGGGGGTPILTVTKAGNGSGTVRSRPAGIQCGTDCTEQYAPGTVVRLTARAGRGSSFVGWSGACSGTGSCVVTMDGPKSVTATFTTP